MARRKAAEHRPQLLTANVATTQPSTMFELRAKRIKSLLMHVFYKGLQARFAIKDKTFQASEIKIYFLGGLYLFILNLISYLHKATIFSEISYFYFDYLVVSLHTPT